MGERLANWWMKRQRLPYAQLPVFANERHTSVLYLGWRCTTGGRRACRCQMLRRPGPRCRSLGDGQDCGWLVDEPMLARDNTIAEQRSSRGSSLARSLTSTGRSSSRPCANWHFVPYLQRHAWAMASLGWQATVRETRPA
jgi:hypothetical protein